MKSKRDKLKELGLKSVLIDDSQKFHEAEPVYKPKFDKPPKKTKKAPKYLKRSRINPMSTNSLPRAIKRAVTAFNAYVRKRAEIGESVCICATCGARKQNGSGLVHAGHFIKSVHWATRFDEQNVHAQCHKCNTFEGGREYEMSRYIDQKYGAGTAEKLYIKSKLPKKYSAIELDELSKLYRAKLKNLKGD